MVQIEVTFDPRSLNFEKDLPLNDNGIITVKRHKIKGKTKKELLWKTVRCGLRSNEKVNEKRYGTGKFGAIALKKR